MTKKTIDNYLINNKDIKNRIKDISKNYCINDFVLLSEHAKDYFNGNDKRALDGVYGCLYDCRIKRLYIDTDVVESRLVKEYMELLTEVLMIEDKAEKVFYVIAYHYLTLCKDVAYKLIVQDGAPFQFWGQELDQEDLRTFNLYSEIRSGEFRTLIDYINKDDLSYYNKLFWELGYHHHSTKHFSILNYLIDIHINPSQFMFDNSFEALLAIFIFRYRAIFTEERVSPYMYEDDMVKIIDGLVEYKQEVINENECLFVSEVRKK